METKDFIAALEELLEEAGLKKEQEPKTRETRHWAVVYTELEKVLAYTLFRLR